MKCRLGCWRSASSPSPKPTASGLCFSAAGEGEPTASPSTMKSPASNLRSSAFFYAVLLAFVVVAAWADYRDTETAVAMKPRRSPIFIYVLQEEAGSKMRKHMAAFIQQVRDSEWEAMAHGLSDRGAEAELQHLGQALFGGRANELKDVALTTPSIW